MQYYHPLEKAAGFSHKALQKISEAALSPTPENYELWYVYFSEENKDLTQAVDILLKSGHRLTDDRCRELHHRFLGDRQDSEKVREAGDKVQNTIKDVNSMVSSVKMSALKYNSNLTDVSEKLANQDLSREQMTLVLRDVQLSTADMITQNKKLEHELSRSSVLMQQLQRDLEIVRKEALTDSLTSLANRKAFDAEMRRILQEAQAENMEFCLILMDIDHFKKFNDNYGHQVGDQVLRLVARTLTEGVKGRDITARFGGEEFAIILPDTGLQGGLKVANSLRVAVATKEIVNRNTDERLGRITMSGGVAEYIPGETSEDLIGRSDAALYTAKHNGRNQIAAAPPESRKKTG